MGHSLKDTIFDFRERDIELETFGALTVDKSQFEKLKQLRERGLDEYNALGFYMHFIQPEKPSEMTILMIPPEEIAIIVIKNMLEERNRKLADENMTEEEEKIDKSQQNEIVDAIMNASTIFINGPKSPEELYEYPFSIAAFDDCYMPLESSKMALINKSIIDNYCIFRDLLEIL